MLQKYRKHDVSPTHLLVVRVGTDRMTLSRPCSACLQKIKAAGIRKVSYSTDDGTIVTEQVDQIKSHVSLGQRSLDLLLKELQAINLL